MSRVAAGDLVTAPKRCTLNRSVTLVLGAPSSHPDIPPPDVVLPAADVAGVPYRISQRHAAITLPPQYSEQRPTIRPLPGGSVWVNDELVGDRGVPIAQGDVINFHDLVRPLSFRVDAVHPFALDL